MVKLRLMFSVKDYDKAAIFRLKSARADLQWRAQLRHFDDVAIKRIFAPPLL